MTRGAKVLPTRCPEKSNLDKKLHDFFFLGKSHLEDKSSGKKACDFFKRKKFIQKKLTWEKLPGKKLPRKEVLDKK